jgi:hypothetical protein
MVNCNIRGVNTPVKIDHAKNVKMEDVIINGIKVERAEEVLTN